MATATAVAALLGFQALAGPRVVAGAAPAVFVMPVGSATPSAPEVAVTKPPVPAAAGSAKAAPPVTRPAPAQPRPAAVVVSSGYGCDSAVTYLEAHAAPGFTFECPGYSLGHQAMTCIDVAGACPGIKLIAISDPCPAAYMNEASNSWVLEGLRRAPIDPYGYCH